MKENGLILKKARSKQYPVDIIMDAGYTDDVALLANTQVKYQLHSLEQAAWGIGLYMNSDEKEFVCFNH